MRAFHIIKSPRRDECLKIKLYDPFDKVQRNRTPKRRASLFLNLLSHSKSISPYIAGAEWSSLRPAARAVVWRMTLGLSAPQNLN